MPNGVANHVNTIIVHKQIIEKKTSTVIVAILVLNHSVHRNVTVIFTYSIHHQ